MGTTDEDEIFRRDRGREDDGLGEFSHKGITHVDRFHDDVGNLSQKVHNLPLHVSLEFA